MKRPQPDEGVAGRYYIETWGCQMNVHDSEKLAGTLEAKGYRAAARARDADVILLNTCSIREKAAEKVFSELGRLQSLKLRRPGVRIGVCGCVAQQEGERIFDRAPYVDFVIGPRATRSLADAVDRAQADTRGPLRLVDTAYRRDSIEHPFDAIRREGLSTGKAFVTVVEGCNHRCTYCVVPQTRGREICRELSDILREVAALAERGVREVEFLGQTVNAYRDSEGHTLADLLLGAAELDTIQRIRFTTSHPAQMTSQLMDALRDAQPKVCPYLHLPVQSGSSRVLRAMRRGYDRAGYLRKIDGIRDRVPGMLFGTDVIVGFPGEDEADFAETMTLLETVPYDTVYSFVYSERPGTAALAMGDRIPEAVKRERLMRLQRRQQEIQVQRNRGWLGREVQLLVEGPSKRDPRRWTGRTPENRIVHFEGGSGPGRFERVRITDVTAFSLQAELVRGVA